ncbi:putative receptor-like protein kinase [Salvia divinorum]
MKILLGTAKALAYLHEAIKPKVVHRDIKSSNILIDEEFNAKVSDFGFGQTTWCRKKSITTRVMGTFGYVAPEYANTGLLNEKSDVYSFGVLLLEAFTGRDPVDYGRPAPEVNLVDWLKVMVGSRRSEEVVDPNIDTRPCLNQKNSPYPERIEGSEERKQVTLAHMDSQRDNYDTDKSDGQELKSESKQY